MISVFGICIFFLRQVIEERTFRAEGGACKWASGGFGEHHTGVFSDPYRSLDFILQAKQKKKIQMN